MSPSVIPFPIIGFFARFFFWRVHSVAESDLRTLPSNIFPKVQRLIFVKEEKLVSHKKRANQSISVPSGLPSLSSLQYPVNVCTDSGLEFYNFNILIIYPLIWDFFREGGAKLATSSSAGKSYCCFLPSSNFNLWKWRSAQEWIHFPFI